MSLCKIVVINIQRGEWEKRRGEKVRIFNKI